MRKIAPKIAAAVAAAVLSGCAARNESVPSVPNVVVVSSAPERSQSVVSTASSSEERSNPSVISEITSVPEESSEITKIPESSKITENPEPEEPYTYTSGLDNYRAKWGYNHISPSQQRLYERFYKAAENYEIEEIELESYDVTTDDVSKAYWAFDHDNPQFLWLGSGYHVKHTKLGARQPAVGITIDFGRSPDTVPQAEFDSIAEEVLAEAAEEATDYDKLRFIHDWIVDNTVYTYTDAKYEYEADGAVVCQKAVCEGYAKAFMYFAQSLGIECVCVIGRANSEDHMWNLVKLYGEWYHVDVTWDDPQTSGGDGALLHTYFLVSDADIKEDHRIEVIFELPEARNTYVQR